MKFQPVQSIEVWLHEMKVGRMAFVGRELYFEYSDDFLQSGLEISPYKLPLQEGAITCDDRVFEGLFGVFNDSLPDGWGRLLLDRQMRSFGVESNLLTPLDRLAHTGGHAMGALRYFPDTSNSDASREVISLDRLAQETAQVLAGDVEKYVDELLKMAGSSAGARPKVMVGVSPDKKHIIHGQQELPEGYEHWMVKFPSGSDPADIGAIEYAYSQMAKSAGVEMPETHLFPAKSGAGYFGIKRFDRIANERIHMHSLGGFLHADHRYPSLDYSGVLQAGWVLTRDLEQAEKLFRLSAFNVLSHNRDDHSKNFAFLMDRSGAWQAAPAYDLTFSNGPGGEHSTTVMGEGKSPDIGHLYKLAEKFDLKNSQQTVEAVRDAISQWPQFAKEVGVSTSQIKAIGNVICQNHVHVNEKRFEFSPLIKASDLKLLKSATLDEFAEQAARLLQQIIRDDPVFAENTESQKKLLLDLARGTGHPLDSSHITRGTQVNALNAVQNDPNNPALKNMLLDALDPNRQRLIEVTMENLRSQGIDPEPYTIRTAMDGETVDGHVSIMGSHASGVIQDGQVVIVSNEDLPACADGIVSLEAKTSLSQSAVDERAAEHERSQDHSDDGMER